MDSTPTRVPVDVTAHMRNYRKALARLTEQFGREPSDEELAADLDLPLQAVDELKLLAIQPTQFQSREP